MLSPSHPSSPPREFGCALETADGALIPRAQVAAWIAAARELITTHTTAAAAPAAAVVAVLAERGPEYVVAFAATASLGGCVVPLEPSLPSARMLAMLRAAAPHLLLATPAQAARARELADALGIRAVDVAQACAAPAPTERAAPLPPLFVAGAAPAEAPAVILFTSGSTGAPKGVVVPHRALVANAADQASRFHVTPSDVLLLSVSCSYAYHLMPLVLALSSGCTLALAGHERQLDGAHVAALLDGAAGAGGVTVLYLVPSPAAVLLRCGAFRAALARSRVRLVSLAGERATAAVVRALDAALPPRAALVNVYGSTETQCIAVQALLETRRGSAGAAVVADGLARGVEAFLAAAADGGCPRLVPLEQAPPGCEGELVVGGEAVALGDLDCTSAATATASQPAGRSRFQPHPTRPGALVYCTGDLVRARGGGAPPELLGRADRQVKVAGVRVDLGAVEDVLLSAPGVSSAHVVLQAVAAVNGCGDSDDDDAANNSCGGGGAALVAVVCPATADADAVVRHCAAALPPAMVPSRVVALPALPLLASGKVDGQALRAAVKAAVKQRRAAAAAAAHANGDAVTRLESEVQRVWARALGINVAAVALRADLMHDLGATSLEVYALAAAVQRAVSPSPPVRPSMLYLNRCVRDFAAVLQAEHALAPPQQWQCDGEATTAAAVPAPSAAVSPDDAAGAAPERQQQWQQQQQQPYARVWPDEWRPLSPLMEGRYFQQCERGVRRGGCVDMHIAHSAELLGDLDVGALRRALELVLQRHEVFRLQLVPPRTAAGGDSDGRVRCRVLPAARVTFEVLAGGSGALADSCVEAAFTDACSTPLDLTSTGPLMRALLAERTPEAAEPHAHHDAPPLRRRHTLLLVVHHACIDMLAMRRVLDELRAAYVALASGREPALPPPGLQYGDVAAWACEQLDGSGSGGGRRAELEAAWREELRGAAVMPPRARAWTLPMPPPGPKHSITLERELGAQLLRVARALGVTLQNVLLAAYAVMMARYAAAAATAVDAAAAAAPAATVWTPVAGRGAPELQGVVAELAHPLPVHLRLLRDDGDNAGAGRGATLGELARAVAAALARCMDRDVLPLRSRQDLAPGVDAAARAWHPGYNPLYQVAFQYFADGRADSDARFAAPLLPGNAAGTGAPAQPAGARVEWRRYRGGGIVAHNPADAQLLVFGRAGDAAALEFEFKGSAELYDVRRARAMAAAYHELLWAFARSGGGGDVDALAVPLPSLPAPNE